MTDHAQAIVNAANESVRDARQFSGDLHHQTRIFLTQWAGQLMMMGRAGNVEAKRLHDTIWHELLGHK